MELVPSIASGIPVAIPQPVREYDLVSSGKTICSNWGVAARKWTVLSLEVDKQGDIYIPVLDPADSGVFFLGYWSGLP